MKFVKMTEFVKLPPGTIYSEYCPRMVTGLYRKGDSSEVALDFNYTDLLPQIENNEDPLNYPITLGEEPGFCTGRHGMYDPEELFIVFAPEDVARLVQLLTENSPKVGE